MTEASEQPVRRRKRRTSRPDGPPPSWPGDPEQLEAMDVDFEAVAHVLANTCRWGGRTRRFLSLAQHALTASEEVDALEGIPHEDRRALALHVLLCCARAAWLGDEDGGHPGSARGATRTRTQGKRVDRAVREAAGLTPEPPEQWAELLRLVVRMTDAAERRDLGVGGGAPFPPSRRTIRAMAPEQAAESWLARFNELAGRNAAGGGSVAPAGTAQDPGA